MALDRLDSILTASLSLNPQNIEYNELLDVLREFRNAAALEGPSFQSSATKRDSLIINLVALIDKMFSVEPPTSDSTLAFSIGVQCVVNLMNDNDSVRKYFADRYVCNLIRWLKTPQPKQQNYVAAALINVEKTGGLDNVLVDSDFVRLLVNIAESDVEFAVHLLQNLITKHKFPILYENVENDQQIFMLQLLESVISEASGCDFVEEVKFICGIFKMSCDNIMKVMPVVNTHGAHELALILEMLASLSYKSPYIELLQNDASLVISSSYLLRGIHESVRQTKTWKESLHEAVETIKHQNPDAVNKPFFGVKGNLIRLLGNLAYENKSNQDEIREAGCIPIVLDSCKLDGDNPFLKEWSILTLRNLCDRNPQNQQFIKNLDFQGCDILPELSLTMDDGEGNQINIAPVQRL